MRSASYLLLHVIHHLHELFAQGIGLFHGVSLAVNANDGFGVRLAQMYPLVGEVDFHAVDVGNLFIAIHLLYLEQDGIDIGRGSEVDTVLCNEIVGEGSAQLAGGTLFVSQ